MSKKWGNESFWEETHGGNWVFFSTVNSTRCELAVLQLSDEDPDFKRYRIVIFDGFPGTSYAVGTGRYGRRQDEAKAEVEAWWSEHCLYAAKGWITAIPRLEVTANGRTVQAEQRFRITTEGMKHIAPAF